MELDGTPEPFSTGTSMLSSLPNIPHSYKEADEEEEEESVRAYTMGPILRVNDRSYIDHIVPRGSMEGGDCSECCMRFSHVFHRPC